MKELGANRARREHGHRDAGSRELATDAFGVGLHERLGGRIACLAGKRVIAGRRPDVEDRAPTAGHHLLHRAGGQVDDGLDVDAHLRDLVGDPCLGDRPDGADACVVHQDVDGQPAVGDGVKQACAGVGIGDIAGDTSTRGFLAEFFREFAELLARRATSVTPWPRATSSRAMSAPIPDEAPVTTAVEVGDGLGKGMARTYKPYSHRMTGHVDQAERYDALLAATAVLFANGQSTHMTRDRCTATQPRARGRRRRRPVVVDVDADRRRLPQHRDDRGGVANRDQHAQGVDDDVGRRPRAGRPARAGARGTRSRRSRCAVRLSHSGFRDRLSPRAPGRSRSSTVQRSRW